MKTKLLTAFFAILSLVTILLIINVNRPKTNIVSWYTADINHDFKDELLVITSSRRGMKLDTGEAYGDHLNIYSDFKIAGHKPILTKAPDYSFDLTALKPLKVQAGDVNGDGLEEISICVYKTAKFHPVLAKRPFFYDLKDGELEPIWLGSRLARPFEDYRLFDVDGDGIDEIVSVELAKNGNRLVAVYDWKGFGFEVKGVSDEINGKVSFLNNTNCHSDDIMLGMEGKKWLLNLNDDKIELSSVGR